MLKNTKNINIITHTLNDLIYILYHILKYIMCARFFLSRYQFMTNFQRSRFKCLLVD